jgi:hypothetical protein
MLFGKMVKRYRQIQAVQLIETNFQMFNLKVDKFW